jgi:hypothetical protein
MVKALSNRIKAAKSAWRTRHWLIVLGIAALGAIVDWSGLANWLSVGFAGEPMSHFFVWANWPFGVIAILAVIVVSLFESLYQIQFGESEAELVKRRDQTAQQIAARLKHDPNSNTWGGVAIIDIARNRNYPLAKKQWRYENSPVFVGKIAGILANDGLRVILQNTWVIDSGINKLIVAEGTPGAQSAQLVGVLPLEWIEHINFDPDAVNGPKLYCNFLGEYSEPFDRVELHLDAGKTGDQIAKLVRVHIERKGKLSLMHLRDFYPRESRMAKLIKLFRR